MKVEVALTQIRNTRLILAFPGEDYVRPGVGDDLINRLAKSLPPFGIMLVAEGAYPRAYAPFDTHTFLPVVPEMKLTRFTVDLSVPPEEEDDELPF